MKNPDYNSTEQNCSFLCFQKYLSITMHQKCTYVEVVVHSRNISAWNKHFIKVKRVVGISFHCWI